ncbi:MAG: four helix bundle protein [Bacteroidetes bacterium]|nr:MAG: four helix bundle protein [Bacteroidota bacterium]RLD69054.1 MAG: four helix bundle protein [Bacteroidota bacterium]RLD86806.1 MAG: four helix bundle protein [Bacteroidota bacterium]
MEKTYLKFDAIDAYRTAFNLSNYVWDLVIKWDNFAKFTVGKQLVESTDSISANIAEGFGRYHKKDKIKFYRYSNGSLLESIDWIKKSKYRGLVTPEEFEIILQAHEKLPLELNQLIKYTNIKLKF